MRLKALLVALAALCVAAPAAAQPAAPVAQEVTLSFPTQGEPTSLDPAHASSASAVDSAVARQIFEPLLRFDENLAPQPAAAASYDVSTDGTTYTFHLRPDGRWSDGQPVTAGQFEFAWKRLLDPALHADYAPLFVDAGIAGASDYSSGKAPTADHVGVNAIDDLTLRIQLAQPFGALPDLAALWVGAPLRPDLVEADPDGWGTNPATSIGNGPFMVSEWASQDHLTLVPNPQYVAHGVWPRPTLTRATILMHATAEQDFASYAGSGGLDWVQVPDDDANQVLNDPRLVQQTRHSAELTTFWVQMNTAHPPLDNALLRHALSRSIDRAALVRDLATGVSTPATSVIPPGMPGFQDSLGQDIAFDVSDARAILAQSGLGDSAPLPRLEFSFPDTPANQQRAAYLRAQWNVHLGIGIELKPMTADAYEQALREGSYELAFGGWSADYPDPRDWLATLFTCGSAFNTFAYCDSSFDQLMARADMATRLSDRLPVYAQAQTLLLQDLPVAPLFVRGHLVLVEPWVQATDGGPLILTPMDDYPGSLFLDRVQILPH